MVDISNNVGTELVSYNIQNQQAVHEVSAGDLDKTEACVASFPREDQVHPPTSDQFE